MRVYTFTFACFILMPVSPASRLIDDIGSLGLASTTRGTTIIWVMITDRKVFFPQVHSLLCNR
jgi:hypothetical protein